MNESVNDQVNSYIMDIDKAAKSCDPQIMANRIYFFMKQDKESVFVKNTQKALMCLKTILRNSYGWSLVDLHRCFSQLKTLTQYFDYNV